MKNVNIPFSEQLIFSNECSLKIENYKWVNNNYKPVVDVFLCHNNKTLKVKFIAFENEISFKEKNDNGRIWCDSCVEFFIKPFEDDLRYINFEINPIGSMIMSIGENGENRNPLVFQYKNELNLKTQIEKNYWFSEFEIPFSMLKEIYNKSTSTQIKKLQGNFYKCGDETKEPHYGMWKNIDEKEPNFHLSKYFGELILE